MAILETNRVGEEAPFGWYVNDCGKRRPRASPEVEAEETRNRLIADSVVSKYVETGFGNRGCSVRAKLMGSPLVGMCNEESDLDYELTDNSLHPTLKSVISIMSILGSVQYEVQNRTQFRIHFGFPDDKLYNKARTHMILT